MRIRDRWLDVRARRWLRKCEAVGEGLRLDVRPSIENHGGQISIGSRFRLASRPVASHLVVGSGALLSIGDDVSIGCGAAIAAFQHIRIGDGTRVGPFVIIMDTSFHGSPGDQTLQHDCRPIMIGTGCLIGTRVTITRGATIGDGAEILAGSVVSSAIPPGVCAAGARAKIIGRAGDLASRWDSAAAVLPGMLMGSLSLESPPDVDSSPIPAHFWTDARMSAVLSGIEDRFGVELDSAAVREIRSFAELAAAIQHVLWERQGHAGSPVTRALTGSDTGDRR